AAWRSSFVPFLRRKISARSLRLNFAKKSSACANRFQRKNNSRALSILKSTVRRTARGADRRGRSPKILNSSEEHRHEIPVHLQARQTRRHASNAGAHGQNGSTNRGTHQFRCADFN